jgi:Mn2+/Fe2+ NRAMP family transporter
LNASLFAASILPLSTAYSVAEAFGWESGVNRKFKEAKNFYLLYGIMIALGVVFVLIPGVSLMQLMWFSQVLNGILLPFIMVFMLKLINNKELMGEYVNSKFYNMIAWGSSILIIAITMVMLYLMLF